MNDGVQWRTEWRSLAALLFGLWLIGCAGGEPSSTTDTKKEDEEPQKPLLEPFDAPPLAELEAKVQWEDRPVLDSFELLREHLASQPQLATTEEALALRNSSDEANAKILSGLGRYPRDDAEADFDATMTRHTRADINSTNPLLASSTSEFEVNSLTSFGLFSFDWTMEPFAAADSVVSWQTSKDRMYDKVVMRDDLTWSDGKPITAHDVEFSFKTIMDVRVPIPAMRSGTDKIRWVEAYDDHTLVFFHKEPLATNVWNLNFGVIPKHIYEKSLAEDPTLKDSPHHVQFENNPVTGGPYVIDKRIRNQQIALSRRESYYMHEGKQVRTKPYFKRVVFRVIEDENTSLLALKNAELDEMILTAEQWQTRTDDNSFYEHNTKVTATEWTTFSFFWNLKTPYFADKRVRQAMSYAFNYDEMLDHLLYGLYSPSVGPFHPDSWASPTKPPQAYKQDLDKAEELLDAAGWTDSDGDGIRDKEINGQLVPFEFSLLTPSIDERIKICALLKENLDRIGIICHVKPLEFTVMQDAMLKHKFHAAFGGWGAGADPDTSSNIFTTEAIKNGRNFGNYSNPEVDKLFEQGKNEFDKEKRAEIYRKIHMLLWEDQPYTWLYYRNAFYAFNKDVRGYFFSPRGPYSYGPGFSSFWKPQE